jgi:hypothetical protein
MTTIKAILIDGPQVLITDNHFIRDDIPRFLASCIDMGYKIWILKQPMSDYGSLNYPCVPMWLQREIIPTDLDTIRYMEDMKFDSKSFILTNDVKLAKSYNLKIPVMTLKDIGLPDQYYSIEIADLLICFGFSPLDFIEFCNKSKLIGIIDDEISINRKNPNGIAYLIDQNINFDEQMFRAKNLMKIMIKNKDYSPSHKQRVIGVTNKGRGLDIIKGNDLSIVMV